MALKKQRVDKKSEINKKKVKNRVDQLHLFYYNFFMDLFRMSHAA